MRLSLFRAVVLSLALLAPAAASAADINLAWDPSPSSAVTGYILKYGRSPGVYEASVDVGNRTTFTVSNLPMGVRYFFAVQAYAGTASTTSALSQEISWAVPIPMNDLDNNGRMDLIWQHDASRQAVVWFNDNGTLGTSSQRYSFLTSFDVTGWTLAASADFSGDGIADLVWQHDATRRAAVWYMGGTPATPQMISWSWLAAADVPGWTIVAARDFNGDGKPDLLWQNDASRQSSVWFMGGAKGDRYDGAGWLSASGVPGWRIVGVADMNADGYADVVFQNDASRQVSVWYLGGMGTTFMGWAWLSANAVPGWRVVGVGDMNGDRTADLVWQNDGDRSASVWFMGGPQGTTLQSFRMLTTFSVAGWTLSVR